MDSQRTLCNKEPCSEYSVQCVLCELCVQRDDLQVGILPTVTVCPDDQFLSSPHLVVALYQSSGYTGDVVMW